jgi:hypothetical protein
VIKTGIETGVLGCGLIRPASGITITKNIYTRYSDLDAKSFLYNSTASGNQIKDGIYTLVKDLKLSGIWDRCIAIYPFVGGSQITFRPNLMNPNLYSLTFQGGATYAATGYTPNGTNGFANTSINANLRLTQNNAHLSFYSRTSAGYNGSSIGNAISSNSISMFIRGTTNLFTAYNATTAVPQTQSVQSTNTDGRGFYISNKTSSAIGGLVAYKNASSIGANTSAITVNSYPSTNILIGALTSTTYFDNKECAFASVGLGFTLQQIIDYTTIVNNFQTIQNRNV